MSQADIQKFRAGEVLNSSLPEDEQFYRDPQKCCEAERGGYVCTRVHGHSGDHIAHGIKSVCARWSDRPKDPRGDFEALQCELAEERTTMSQFLDDFSAIDELLDTGSVTVETSKGNIVFTLHVEDERK